MLKRLSAIILDPDLNARVRLREALRLVALTTEVTFARTIAQAISDLQFATKLDVIFIASSWEEKKIDEFINSSKSFTATSKTTLILVLKSEQRESTFIAPYLLKGVTGFICEPFSVDQILEAIGNAQDAKENSNDAVHTKLVLTKFLYGDAIRHLDRLAYFRATEGEGAGGFALRDFREVGRKIREYGAELNDKLPEVLLKSFEDLPLPREVPIHLRVKKKETPHPGHEIRALISARGITVQHLGECLKLTVEATHNLLSGEIPITDHIAQALSHNIGSSATYWMGAQKKYDRANKRNPNAKGVSKAPGAEGQHVQAQK